jgi:hypothetical protein
MQVVDDLLRVFRLLVPRSKSALAFLTSSCFQALIIVGCTPNSEANSASVLSPDKAAIATCALNSPLCCLRFAPMLHVPFNRSALAYPTVQKNVTAAAFAGRKLPKNFSDEARYLSVLERAGF